VFGMLDLVAVIAVVVAIARRERQIAVWALVVAAVGALACLVATGVAVATGIGAANATPASSVDPSQQAREMATGLSLAMNGAVLGVFSTFINAVAALVCLLIALLRRPKPEPAS
jgi:hypothetical protein